MPLATVRRTVVVLIAPESSGLVSLTLVWVTLLRSRRFPLAVSHLGTVGYDQRIAPHLSLDQNLAQVPETAWGFR